MFMSKKTSDALDILVGLLFNLNRTFDRAVSVLENKFAMPNAASIIHHNLAHLFPALADVITDYKSQWNLPSVYPVTHEDGRDYNNLLEMMETLLNEFGDFYEGIKMAFAVANDEGDLNTCALLYSLTRMTTKLMGQIITLRDKAEQLSHDYDTYDRHIDSWHIDGLVIEV